MQPERQNKPVNELRPTPNDASGSQLPRTPPPVSPCEERQPSSVAVVSKPHGTSTQNFSKGHEPATLGPRRCVAIGPSIRLLPADDHESVPDVENDVYM